MRGRPNPVARALRRLRPKVVKMKTRYARKRRTGSYVREAQ